MTHEQAIIASTLSNIIGLLLLLLSWKRKNLARTLFAILFLWAGIVNFKTAYLTPGDYLNYSKYALPLYKKIISGEFSKHITGYVSFIATCQFLIGLGLFARGLIVKLSCIGGIIFLLAIAPLGLGAAFPFSLTTSAGLFILYRYHFEKDIFRNKWFV